MGETSPIGKAIDAIGNMSFSRVALLALVLTGVYFTVFYDSGALIIQNIESSKALLDVENNKKLETQKVLKKEQQMKADVELLAKKFEEIKSKIPLEFLESELRTIIDQYSSQNNLKTTRTERRQAPRRNSQNATGNENLIEQLVLGYEFEGSYNNIAKFVSEISNLEKLIRIGDFSLGMRSDPNRKTKDLVFNVSIIGYKQSLEALNATSKAGVK